MDGYALPLLHSNLDPAMRQIVECLVACWTRVLISLRVFSFVIRSIEPLRSPMVLAAHDLAPQQRPRGDRNAETDCGQILPRRRAWVILRKLV